jgi:hypothetical protein
MKITPSALLNIVLVTILATSLFLMVVRSATSPYDPWADTDDNGFIDIKDILYTALQYGATGDPTKPVIVQGYNWSAGSCAFNVPSESGGNLNIITAGYKQITLGFKSLNYFDVTTGFLLGSYYAYLNNFAVFKPVVDPTENTMWIEPSEVVLNANSHPIGYKFNVTIWINLNVASAAWQFRLLYNKDYLNATRCGYTYSETYSDFYKNIDSYYHFYVNPVLATYNSTHNKVQHGEALIYGASRSLGYGSLSWVEFEVMAEPPEGQEIVSMLDISSEYHPPTGITYALDPNGVEIPMTVRDCSYTTNWNLPEYDVVKTYTVTGPVLTIRYFNPNLFKATLLVEYYMTT